MKIQNGGSYNKGWRTGLLGTMDILFFLIVFGLPP